jgi:predicted DNA-binding protein YlxM (UPF0122 family)
VKLSNPELAHMYEQDGLSLGEIAKSFGVSRQAVHYRLKQTGVQMRPPGERVKIDRQTLVQLYAKERLAIREIANVVQLSDSRVYQLLRVYGIPLRKFSSYPIKYPVLKTLKIGEYVDLPRPGWNKPQTSFHSMAKGIGIRVSCRTIDERTMRVTRIE